MSLSRSAPASRAAPATSALRVSTESSTSDSLRIASMTGSTRRQLLGGRHRVGARAGGFPAHVQDVGAGGDHRPRGLQRRLRPRQPAGGIEGIGRAVEHPHDPGPGAEVQDPPPPAPLRRPRGQAALDGRASLRLPAGAQGPRRVPQGQPAAGQQQLGPGAVQAHGRPRVRGQGRQRGPQGRSDGLQAQHAPAGCAPIPCPPGAPARPPRPARGPGPRASAGRAVGRCGEGPGTTSFRREL